MKPGLDEDVMNAQETELCLHITLTVEDFYKQSCSHPLNSLRISHISK